MTSERAYTKQIKRNMRMMVWIQQILAYDHDVVVRNQAWMKKDDIYRLLGFFNK